MLLDRTGAPLISCDVSPMFSFFLDTLYAISVARVDDWPDRSAIGGAGWLISPGGLGVIVTSS